MHRPHKLAFDARPAQGKATGVATYSLNLIKHFAALVGEFDFVFIVDSTLEMSHIAFPSNSKFINTSIGRGGGLRNWILRDYFEQILLPRRLVQLGVHLYHQPDYSIPIRPVPFVVVPTFLDAIAFTSDDDRGFLAKARVRMLMRKGANNADAIVTISDFSKRELGKYLGIEPCRIKKVWCGVSESFFSPVNDESVVNFRQKLGFREGFLLYFGGFGKRKNVGLLLGAFKLVHEKKDIKLVLAGNLDSATEKKIESLGLKKSVIAFGFAQEEELKILLHQCSVFVFPSSMEGFGLPVAEAMACGAPVVCSTNGSLPEIAGSAVQYFESDEPGCLASAILKVLENDDYRESLKCQSRYRAREFRWEIVVAELKNLYLDLIEKKDF